MRFYVYEISYAGQCVYIGKGSRWRSAVQAKAFGLPATIVARFASEKQAYQFERDTIKECQPWLNRHPGGNGCTATKIRKRTTAEERLMAKIGTRAFAARVLLRYAYMLKRTDVKDICSVANTGKTRAELLQGMATA